jgi:hypothetical protein
VSFDGSVGGEGCVAVEVIEAFCVIVGEAALRLGVDLTIVAEVDVALGTEGEEDRIGVVIVVTWVTSLVRELARDRDAGRVFVKVVFGGLDAEGLEGNKAIGEDFVAGYTKLSEAEELEGLVPD